MDAMEQKAKKAPAQRGKGKGAESAPQEPEVERASVAINVEGIALDNKTVADFMTRMTESRVFADVRLITLRQQNMKAGDKGDVNLKGFQISCIKPPAQKTSAPAADGEKEKK